MTRPSSVWELEPRCIGQTYLPSPRNLLQTNLKGEYICRRDWSEEPDSSSYITGDVSVYLPVLSFSHGFIFSQIRGRDGRQQLLAHIHQFSNPCLVLGAHPTKSLEYSKHLRMNAQQGDYTWFLGSCTGAFPFCSQSSLKGIQCQLSFGTYELFFFLYYSVSWHLRSFSKHPHHSGRKPLSQVGWEQFWSW